MSHEVKYTKCVMANVDIIDIAAARQGLELLRGAKTRKTYGGRHVKCEHALRVVGNPNAYEAGLVATREGYVPEFDTFGVGGHALSERMGPGATKLLTAYEAVSVEEFAREEGHAVASVTSEVRDGDECLVYELEVA